MNADELEAVIWRHWPRCATREEGRRAVAAILLAAYLYREDTAAITAGRRAVLARENPLRREGSDHG